MEQRQGLLALFEMLWMAPDPRGTTLQTPGVSRNPQDFNPWGLETENNPSTILLICPLCLDDIYPAIS